MNYKHVALDVGNILVHVNFNTFTEALSKQQNITVEEAGYFMSRSCALHDMGMTKMEHELHDHFKIRSPLIMKDLLECWNKVIVPNTIVIDFFNDLSIQNKIEIALVSNVGLEHAIQMERLLDRGGFFRRATKHLSCQVGARKPTKLYYQSFLAQFPQFKNCAYLDDMHENLEASKQFGFRTYHFNLQKDAVTPEKLQDIKQFILGVK